MLSISSPQPRLGGAPRQGSVFFSAERRQHRPREDGFAHPADTSRTNLADALGLRSRRLSKP